MVILSRVEEHPGAVHHLHPISVQVGHLHFGGIQTHKSDMLKRARAAVFADVIEKLFDVRIGHAKTDKDQPFGMKYFIQQTEKGTMIVSSAIIIQSKDDRIGPVMPAVGMEHQPLIPAITNPSGFRIIPEEIGSRGLGVKRGPGIRQTGVVVQRQVITDGQLQQSLVRKRICTACL